MVKKSIERSLPVENEVNETPINLETPGELIAGSLDEAYISGQVDKDGNGIPDIPVERPKTVAEKQKDNAENEIAKLKSEIEALKSQLTSVLPLENLMQDKYFGTTTYLIVDRFVTTDPNGKKIYTKAQLSAFPDTIDKLTGNPLAPDLGFDSREEADEFRNSNATVKYFGKMIPIKDAIADLRNKYYEKRMKADREFLKMAILARQ